jgi:hypothetical protein
VVERYRQVVVVHPPERVEEELGLGTGVDEDERCPDRLDPGKDRLCRIEGDMPGPGHLALRQLDLDERLGAGAGFDDAGALGIGAEEGRRPGGSRRWR